MTKKSINPYLSVVIPVYNEQDCIETLYNRLTSVLDKLDLTSEIVITNDGSTDNTSERLKEIHNRRPNQIRIIEFKRNFGQHMAIIAGFEYARGDVIVNMDADMQNPPEEIPKLLEKFKEGHDLVCGYREDRNDNWFRKLISKTSNIARTYMTGAGTKDHGCMLRAYSRDIAKQLAKSKETSTFITVTSWNLASNPIDIPVKHEYREEGDSKYTPYKLIQYSLDMFATSSLAPLRLYTMLGFTVSGLSAILVSYLLVRRLIIGPEAEGLFTLFAISFFLISVVMTGVGLLGEYIGRIYEIVRERPKYLVKEILEEKEE